MSRNPAVILYDAYSTPVATLDGYDLSALANPGIPILGDQSGIASFFEIDAYGRLKVNPPTAGQNNTTAPVFSNQIGGTDGTKLQPIIS